MVRWLAFLFWLFSFSTWKAFLVRIFMKPPDSGDEDRCVEEPVLSSKERPHVEEVDGDRRSGKLADLLDRISREAIAVVNLRAEGECISISASKALWTGVRDSYKEVMGAIATSTALKVLDLRWAGISPDLIEGLSKALLSNRSVKIFNLWTGRKSSPADKVVEMMSGVLLKNECLEDVTLWNFNMNNQGALLGNALHRNRTLKRLVLYDVPDRTCDNEEWKLLLEPLSGGDESNHVLEHFSFVYRPALESQNCDAHIANMVRKNTSLHTLRMDLDCEDPEAGTIFLCSIGEALCFNTRLSCLGLVLDGNFRRDDLKGLFTSLTPNAKGQQANTTLKHLDLYSCHNNHFKIDSLVDMLQSNTSLIKLTCHGSILKVRNIIQFLESLKSNKCLEILDLSKCDGVQGRKVLETIMDLLLENHHLKEIILDGTPLEEDGSSQIVQAELEKKAKYHLWKVVEGMATKTPTSGRVFLCGEPFAGKTTLRKTIMESHSLNLKGERTIRERFITKLRKPKRPRNATSAGNNGDERTRGIEIHNLSCNGIAMTLWDMAGQEEYHAFHDLVVPNFSGGGSCCSFILVYNPLHDYKTLQMKNNEDVKKELQYWLRFIVSNTRISYLYKPHVTIVFTHIDKWSSDVLYSKRIKEEVNHLKQQFQDLLEFDRCFMIDARCKDSVDDLFKAMVDHLKSLLARVPKTIQACTDLQHVITKWIQDNPNELVLEWQKFSLICDEVQELQVFDISYPGLVEVRKKFAALSLHDAGHLIYHEDLNIIVMNPHLFCHDIMGELIAKCTNEKSRCELICNGCIRKEDLQLVLSSFPTAEQYKVSLEDVLHVMLKLELCYEQGNGTIIIPATLKDGHEKLIWPCEIRDVDYTYIGRRFGCDDTARTLLSPGFFPRLQVSLRKEFENTYEIMKDFITFIYDGMEVIIEYSGSNGFYIDIMIRSNVDEDIILDFLHVHLRKHIFNLCQHPTLGCPGVKLVEFIMRPFCVEKLVSCKGRRNQVVLVENLKRMVLARGNLAVTYTWPKEGTLKSGIDSARTLLGKKMSDDLLNQFIVDLKGIEDKIESNHSKKMDINDPGISLTVAKATNPLNVTNEDLKADIGELKADMHHRFDRLEGKIQKIKLFQAKLLPKICTNLEVLVTFTKEFKQHKYPRLAFFTTNDKDHLKHFVTRMVPGMTSFVVQLLCEHKDGFHFVKDQEGCEVSFGTESTQKFQTVVKWGLRVFTLLLKVGAHVGAGMGSMIPDLSRGFLLLADTPGILDGVDSLTALTMLDMNDPFISRHDEEVAQQWLIDILKANCKSTSDFQKMFQLQKVRYKENGSVAWICNEHVVKGRDTLDLLPSDLDG